MHRARLTISIAALLTAAGIACGQVINIGPTNSDPPPGPFASSSSAATGPDAAFVKTMTEYASRLGKLKDDDVEGRITLARWAYNQHLYGEATEMADQALYRDPNNRAAYTILQQVDDARPLPPEPEQEEALKAEMKNRFKRDFKTRNSKHFLICYDTTDAFAAQRGTLMEKTYDAFRFYFNMNTLRPEFLDQRLVVVLLKDRDDYLAYARQTEHQDFSWTGGMYSQHTNRSCFFDEASGPTAASFTKEASGLKSQIDDLGKQINAANAQGQLGMVHTLTLDRNRASEALAQLNLHIGTQVNLQNNSATMHEAAHQVAFNLGIQSRLVDYPMWFAEGLACSFEFEDAEGHRGPALQNPGRTAVIKTALRDNKLIPIDTFISSDPTDMTDYSVASLEYAEGWALFHYLYKFHRQGMEDYLVAFKTHTAMRAIGSDQRKVMFTKAFGNNLDELNKKFVAYLKSLPGKPG